MRLKWFNSQKTRTLNKLTKVWLTSSTKFLGWAQTPTTCRLFQPHPPVLEQPAETTLLPLLGFCSKLFVFHGLFVSQICGDSSRAPLPAPRQQRARIYQGRPYMRGKSFMRGAQTAVMIFVSRFNARLNTSLNWIGFVERVFPFPVTRIWEIS